MSFATAHVCECGHFRAFHSPPTCRECDCDAFNAAHVPEKHAGRSARDVASTDAAQELARKTGGKSGVWTKADEELLARGIVRTPLGDYHVRSSR